MFLNLYREKGISDVSLAEYLYLERRCSEGTQSYSAFSNFSELPFIYQPKSETVSLPISIFSVPKEELEISFAHPSTELLRKYIQEKTVSFCVHPAFLEKAEVSAELKSYEKSGSHFIAGVPLSCSRTLTVLDPQLPLHSIKLHCPFKISRFYRNLGPLTIRHCVSISKALAQTSLAYFPETLGIAFPSTPDRLGFGFLIREMHQYSGKLIPCFSLYGNDQYHPGNDPFLVRWIRELGVEPKSFVLEKIMFPIIRDFLEIYQTQGILLEAHAQNTLLELDSQLLPKRVIHRDLDCFIDFDWRQQLGLSLEGLRKYGEYPPMAAQSLIYDNSIGHHHFEFLAKTMENYFQISAEAFRSACREKFAELLPDFSNHFPTTVYYYSDKPVGRNDYPLIDTQKKPSWRSFK